MQKAETAEMADEKGWAAWIRIILGKAIKRETGIALAVLELVFQPL